MITRSGARSSAAHLARLLTALGKLERPPVLACDHLPVDADQEKATTRWYKERHQELREIMWQWDPLGIMGVADDEYDCLIDPVLSALTRGLDAPGELKSVLREGLQYMAGDLGYSQRRADNESQDDSLAPVAQRVTTWWASTPPAP